MKEVIINKITYYWDGNKLWEDETKESQIIFINMTKEDRTRLNNFLKSL